MSDHRTISKRKDAFLDWLRALAPDERHLAILAACGETAAVAVAPSWQNDPLIRALAYLALVQYKFYAGPEQGEKYLGRGLRSLRAVAGADPRAARYVRDAHNTAGNFHARHFHDLKAFKHYTAALAGERAPDRRALVTTNLVKLLLAQGRLREALVAVDRVDPVRAGSPVGDALRLQRVRLLLMLGGAPAAEDLVRATRGSSPAHRGIELERRYLGLMLRVEAARDPRETAKRLADFLAFAAAEHPPAVAAFYELELLVLGHALGAGARGWPAKELVRAKALAKSANAKDTLALYAALRAALKGRAGEAAVAGLREVLSRFAARDSQILFRAVCLGVARQLTAARRPDAAAPFLRLYDERTAALSAGMPPRVLARILARPSPLLAWRNAQGAAGDADRDGERLAATLFG